MTSSPASSTIRLPEHPECPVCFGKYDSVVRIPTASGIPGCSHNACAPCVQQLAAKIAGMNMKRCVQGCTVSQNDLSNLSLASVKHVPNTDLTKAIDVIAELSGIISALRSNAPMGTKDSSEEFLAMQAFLVGQIEELNKQFALAQESIKELKKENSELKERVSAEPPAASSSMPVVVQPQPPCSSTDLRERITQLVEQPVITCSSSDCLTSEPAVSSVTPYTKDQMNTFFPSNVLNHTKMHSMNHALLYATIRAGNFSSTEQFSMLSDDQWKGLPLSRMPAAQVKLMFPLLGDVGWRKHYSDRMKMIQPAEVREAILKGKITDKHIFSFIPAEYLKGLPLSQLDSDVIYDLLLANGEMYVPSKLLKISNQEICAAILDNKMIRSELSKALSDECFIDLQLSLMSAEQIQLLFPRAPTTYWKDLYRTRMSKILPDELRAAFRDNKLNGYLTQYLPPNFSSTPVVVQPQPPCSSSDRLRSEPPAPVATPFSDLQMNTLFSVHPAHYLESCTKIQRLDPAVLHATIQAGNFSSAEQFDMLSDAQWEALPLEKMPAKQIQLMFPLTLNSHQNEILSKRMRLISAYSIQKAITNGNINESHIFRHIFNSQLGGLKLAKLTPTQASRLLLAHGKSGVVFKLLQIGNARVFNAILENRMNHVDLLIALPDDLLKVLPLSKLSNDQILQMFPSVDSMFTNPSPAERATFILHYRKRMELIPLNEIRTCIRAGKLTGYLASYVPSAAFSMSVLGLPQPPYSLPDPS